MLALGNTHLAVHGFGSSEFGTTFTAAVDLCRDLGPEHVNANRLLGRALFGVWAYKLHVGQLTASRTIAQELLALTRTDEDAQPRVISAIAYGVSCVSLASLKEAARTFAFGAVGIPTKAATYSNLIAATIPI
jgi:hypothetical protein